MAKLPFMQLYKDAWQRDTCTLSLAARGLWHEILLRMHDRDQSGVLAGTIDDLARATFCFPDEFKQCLAELEQKRICEVSRRRGLVTVVNRRMKREADAREAARLRQIRKRHGNESEDVTPLSLESSPDCHASVTPHIEEEDIKRIYSYEGSPTRKTTPTPEAEEREIAAASAGVGEPWITELSKSPAYSGVDVRHVYWKLVEWCKGEGEKPTRRRLVNWLNNERRAPTVNGGADAPRETASERNVRNIREGVAAVERAFGPRQDDKPNPDQKPHGLLAPGPKRR